MVEVDTVLGLLNEQRRRYALYYLTEQDGPVHVDEVVEAVAEMESNPDQVSSPERKYREIEISIEHTHLPKASEAEFIEYDPEKREIRLTDNPTEFDTILTIAKVLEGN
ncbi:DUF7344 domain-containing protein [Natrononativus amylolyticus]|uniref:DUF7344 domain-containing protein n=1 Tax=Natrononativus amylolyticus TaxID=2963434 RepID=UPI0020CF839E|nr:hypothetical protein [Natrononativus amylolyticus]